MHGLRVIVLTFLTVACGETQQGHSSAKLAQSETGSPKRGMSEDVVPANAPAAAPLAAPLPEGSRKSPGAVLQDCTADLIGTVTPDDRCSVGFRICSLPAGGKAAASERCGKTGSKVIQSAATSQIGDVIKVGTDHCSSGLAIGSLPGDGTAAGAYRCMEAKGNVIQGAVHIDSTL